MISDKPPRGVPGSRCRTGGGPCAGASAHAAMLLLVCLLAAAAPARSADCVIDNITPDLSWEATLFKDLKTKCAYTRNEAPSSENATVVTMHFILKNFFFDAGEESLSIYSWAFLDWLDPRLTWNPKDYGGIDRSKVFASAIWTPVLKLQNSKDAFEIPFMVNGCQVSNEGRVRCVMRVLNEIACTTKLSNWPYDTQTCRFEFSKRDALDSKFTFTFGNTRAVRMWGAEYGPGWIITDYKQVESHAKAEAQMYFELTLERQAAGLGALAVAPALALSALTLAVPLLAACGPSRAPLAVLSELGHFTVLQIVNFSIPQHSGDSPTILKYLQCSLLITTVSIIVTFVLNHLSKKSTSPPGWVTHVNTRALSWWPGRAVGLGATRDSVTEAVSKRHQSEWLDFANLCNCFFFIAIGITYCVLYFAYIPQPPPFF
ncbi:neuronal acetylcholine receptor subunit alpha-4-like [Zerene cesonia]|uniref:neuronal acetylcholine receptor subunit alpha-4-like n=1 Tax=Zerene cesonia TaxID=33412 RepID=UPI0018E57C9C|nr:neuronal acetylcholine receptor subunit alpha-4-like [Zerene cesonia]